LARFNLCSIRPRGFLHASAFTEVKDSLAWALTALGHETMLTENTFSNGQSRNIIFGAELLSPESQIPDNSIIFNYEQPTHPRMESVRKLAKGHQVWDFSIRNVERWKSDGYDVRHVPVGYTPNLTRIPKLEQDIDVLFYGWMTPRRIKIISDLKVAGLNVVATDSAYGGGRDNLIARSKVVLNVHHDGRDMFEIVRVSYLMANSKCVVSEQSSDEDGYGDLLWGIGRSPYGGIVDACVRYARNGNGNGPEQKAFELFSKQDYVATVAAALDGSVSLDTIKSKFNQATSTFCGSPILDRYIRGCQEGDMKDFLPWIREHAKGKCLEIGTRDGASTSAFLLGLEDNGGHLLSVDVDDCSGLWTHPQWTFRRANSVSSEFPDATFDVALIDGSHVRDAFIGDLYNCWHWVKPGGLILSHDIKPERGHEFYAVGLREEWFKFCREHEVFPQELPGMYGMGVIIKK